ncbi:MAG: DUF1565 domain-containing protein, partial [Dysgonamonadaceae bacterium]|nr:DUF1565 domain-containing protein [Dysgonamonadaceae bacterium]
MKERIILLMLLCLTIVPNGSAKQYFIAPNGNDAQEGSLEAPFSGFEKAYGLAVPGDTIYVRGGTYTVSTMWKMSKPGTLENYY